MDNNIYLENGYLDMKKLIFLPVPYIFIVGARGTGKTYGALKTIVENDMKFMYLRRTQTQLDIVTDPEYSVFRPLNKDLGWSIMPRRILKGCGFYHTTEAEDGSIIFEGAPIGYAQALSTMHNLRSFDGSDIDILCYDEFIPEHHAKKIADEGAAFFNIYETLNRNRELEGRPPIKCVCMANSDTLANPLFMYLGVVQKVESMKQKGQVISLNKDKGLALVLVEHSPISKKKSETALYKLTAGTEFDKIALENEFAELNYDSVRPQSLKEYRPVAALGELCIYKHKSNPIYYVSTHISGAPKRFTTSDADIARFKKRYYYLWTVYLKNKILFEDSSSEVLFNSYMGVL